MRLEILSAAAVTTVVFAAGMGLRFGGDPELPPKPVRPAAKADLRAFRALDYSEGLYRARLERDAALLGVSPDPLTGVFPHHVEEPRRVLHAGGAALHTRDLALSARVARLTARFDKGSFTSDHLVLRIENRTDRHLAYRVEAVLPLDPRGCLDGKAILVHNAIALAPGEAVERTECARGGTTQLTIERVETVALPPLAYHYVSQLHPVHIGLDGRAAQGHMPPAGSVCGDVPEQAIRRGIENRQASWRDVIDFYARHSCQAFIFPVGYRAFTAAEERPLPARPARP